MFCCLECGRAFKTVKAAERAADHGCPKCGGVDIDLARAPVSVPETHRLRIGRESARMPDAVRAVTNA